MKNLTKQNKTKKNKINNQGNQIISNYDYFANSGNVYGKICYSKYRLF
jgi:hypothetical protein